MPPKMHTLAITPYAAQLMTRPAPEDYITSAEAARMLGRSHRTINRLCDEGILVEGKDWWRLPSRSRGGNYSIKKSAILRLKGVQPI